MNICLLKLVMFKSYTDSYQTIFQNEICMSIELTKEKTMNLAS